LKTPLVGRTPWSAADAPVGLLASCQILNLQGNGWSKGTRADPTHPRRR
jgi:hypothetical protein